MDTHMGIINTRIGITNIIINIVIVISTSIIKIGTIIIINTNINTSISICIITIISINAITITNITNNNIISIRILTSIVINNMFKILNLSSKLKSITNKIQILKFKLRRSKKTMPNCFNFSQVPSINSNNGYHYLT